MADEAQRNTSGSGWFAAAKTRLFGRLLMLLTIGIGYMAAAGLDLVNPWICVLAFAGTALIAAFIPETHAGFDDADAVGGGRGPAFSDAIRQFADALPHPAMVLDRRSVIIHLNPEAKGHFPAAVQGNPIAFSLRFPALISAIELARTGVAQTIELHQTVPTETWYAATVAPLAPGDPLYEGIIVISLQSLTESKRLEALRTDFIANASHELRTPLTSLVGFIDTLLGPAANDRDARERFLNLMRAQATRMSKLIDDLLSLSRIEMRQHVRPTAPVELASLLREVSEGLQTQAANAGTSLKLDLPHEPLTVSGDRDELYEVFENLLDNAIKYGAEGGDIEVVLGPSNARGFDASVTVTDHGAGVAAEHVPRLTERFYRVDAESSRKKKGTGLGLAIVKHIVHRHHGLLTIRSQPGNGTRVEVVLRR